VITLDAYAASHRAVRELKAEGKMPKRVRVRSSKYLNNGSEQDHRRVKQRIRPMLGFKRFQTAAVTISGIELAAKIRKQQFKVGKLPRRPSTIPAIWTAVVACIVTNPIFPRELRAQTLHQNPLIEEIRESGAESMFPVAMPATSISTALWLKKQIRAGEESIVL
jgi:hypothetical protein